MTVIYVALAIVVVAAAWYVIFSKPKNQFLIEIGKMSGKERAMVLVSATVWRIQWEKDNPQFSGIFLEPRSFSPEVYNRLFSDLFDLIVLLRNQAQVLNMRLAESGIYERLPENDINALRVWTQTIGARRGKIKLDDIVVLWNYLREAMPFINEALAALEAEQEIRLKFGSSSSLLGSLPVQQITQEAHRVPNLSA
jgi:hypothetical protein